MEKTIRILGGFVFLLSLFALIMTSCNFEPAPQVPSSSTVTTEENSPAVTTPEETVPEVPPEEITTPEGTTSDPHIHTTTIDPAVAPTCTEAGMTAGTHCSVCNEIIKAQEFIKPFGHTEINDASIAPTCTTTGLTTGKHCSVCNEILVAQEIVDALGHTAVIDPAVAATCTKTGLTEGKHCSVCGEIIVVQEIIEKLKHTEVIDEAVFPTCTETGLTEGKHCERCNEVLVAQEVVDTLGHSYNAIVTAPDCLNGGYTTYTCSVCDNSYVADETNALGHTEVIDEAVAPTCTETGLAEGKHCSACNETIVKQEIVSAAHLYKTQYNFDNNFHWLECENCDAQKEKTEHQFSNDLICPICNLVIYTEGIIYSRSNDGTYAIVDGYKGTSTTIRIADTYQGLPVKIINQWAFSRASIISVIIPNSVTTIGNAAFSHCENLTSVTMGNSIVSIGQEAFFNCDGLTSIVLPDSVTFIDRDAFYACNNLTSVIMSNNIAFIGIYAFDASPTKLQFNEYMNCKYLGSKENPYLVLMDVTALNTSNYTIHKDTKVIASAAFRFCSNLTSIVIPDKVISIGDYAFGDCENLTSVVIPDKVTSIGDHAFAGCSNLTNVTIGKSVTTIGSYAFASCENLTSIIFSNPNGWQRTSDPTATSGIAVSADSLSVATTAAAYLSFYDYNYYWFRS